ncbi:hypothetical protein [Rhizobium leucaenae]|uniref:Tail fiber protein n=1 Tax=Rhizobium leucaenae TaxID=29450 RepID=A0A7W7A009_9HYPH|nr:hypothetical protein [Rhizobium leucaenae]MBB4571744.1 hypothetical protein [Rhizobium leucaenae]
MNFSPNAQTIWADGPAFEPTQPYKPDIRKWGTAVENAISALASGSGTIAKDTRVNLYADLAHDADTMAWVYADTTTAYNGIYRKSGASGAGSWSLILPLPYSFIIASDVGVGTPNAIQATTSIPVSSSALVWVTLADTTTASPVTIQFNSDSLLTIKTNTGNDPVVGGLTAGMTILGIKSGTTFRLLNDQVSSAIVAAAEDAADRAEAAAAGVNLPSVTVSDARKVLEVKADGSGFQVKLPYFRPSTTDSTIERTVETKLREWASVDDFRKGSDVGWTTTALRAIAELQAAGGGTLLFPGHDYDMGPTLTINPVASGVNAGWHNIILTGAGYGTRLKFDNTLTGQDGVAWAGWGGRCGMRDMQIMTASGKGVNWNAAEVRGGPNYISRFFMENMVVDGCAGDNISFLQTYMGMIRNVESRNGGAYGFKCNGTHTSMAFERCWAGGDAAAPSGGNQGGWYLNGLLYSYLEACGADWNNGPGYIIKNSQGLRLIAFGAESNKQEGVLIVSSTDDSSNLPIVGCQGISIEGFGAYNNGKQAAGTYANAVGVVTANSQDVSVNIQGVRDIRNDVSDPTIVLNCVFR